MLSGIVKKMSYRRETATGHVDFSLGLHSNDISILREKLNFDSPFECEIKFIKNMSDTTSIRGSID